VTQGESAAANGDPFLAVYSREDENLGIEWQLSVRDLTKKAEWETWKILEFPPGGSGSELQAVEISAEPGVREVPTRR
jgi:hypothetical protein